MMAPLVVAENYFLEEADGLLGDLPVVMSATRLPQPLLRSPVSTTVLDRTEIQASGFTHIVDLFRLVPGFQVAKATGGHTVVTYHGQELSFPRRIEVLVDGRSVYDNLLSSVKWQAIGVQTEDVEYIEVIRGSNAPVFGSNAMVATINIHTRAPIEQAGAALTVTASDDETRRVQGRFSGSAAGVDYTVSTGYHSSEGADDRGFLDFESVDLSNLSLRGQYSLNKQDFLDIQLGVTRGETGTFLHEPSATFLSHQSDLDSQYYFARWTHNGVGRESYWQIYHNVLSLKDDFNVGSLYSLAPAAYLEQVKAVYADQDLHFYYAQGKSERTDAEFQSIELGLPHGKLAWGGGLRLDTLETPHISPHTSRKNLSGRAFANYELPVGVNGQMNFGGMMEHNELVNFLSSSRIAYSHSIDEGSSWRFNIGHAERSPSMLDEYANVTVELEDGTLASVIQVSPGNIREEHLLSAELGYAASYAHGRWLIDVKAFYEKGDHILSNSKDESAQELIIQDGAEIVANDDEFVIRGIEGQVKFRPRRNEQLSLQYSLSDSQRHHISELPNKLLARSDVVTPKRTLSLLYFRDFSRGYSASVGWYYMSDMNWLGDGGYQESYDRVDARIGKTLFFPKSDATLELIAHNILNNEYVEYGSSQNIIGQTLMLKAGYKF